MDSKTIKIRKGNAKTFTFSTEKEDDKLDICIYENGEKCMTIKPSSTEKTDDGYEHTIKLSEEDCDELGEGDYDYCVRIDGEEFEDGTLNIYKNAKDSKED